MSALLNGRIPTPRKLCAVSKTRLKKLTAEQEALIPVIRDKWINWALNPSGRSHSIIQQNMNFLYEQAGLQPVSVIVCDTMKDFVSRTTLFVQANKSDSVGDSVGDSVRGSVWDSVRDSVGASVGDSVRDSVRGSVWDSVWDSVGASVGGSVWGSVWASVGGSVWGSVWASVGSYFWADDIAWGNYFEEIGILTDQNLLDKFHRNIDALQDCAFGFITDKICIVLVKPTVTTDDQGRLHNDSKMAMKWSDTDGFYYLAGVKFEKQLWEKVVSGQMSFKEILDIENTEQRLQAMRFNPNALLKENPKLVHKSKRGNELWCIENSEVNKLYDEKKVWLLGFIDPSKKAPNNKMYEEVSPQLAKASPDADVIQAYHCGLTFDEYKQLKLET
jgi:hypothetical protein